VITDRGFPQVIPRIVSRSVELNRDEGLVFFRDEDVEVCRKGITIKVAGNPGPHYVRHIGDPYLGKCFRLGRGADGLRDIKNGVLASV
jgi:hypothetical protein